MTAVMHISNATWALAAWGVPAEGHAAMLMTAILPFNLARMMASTLITFPVYLGILPMLKRIGWNHK